MNSRMYCNKTLDWIEFQSSLLIKSLINKEIEDILSGGTANNFEARDMTANISRSVMQRFAITLIKV